MTLSFTPAGYTDKENLENFLLTEISDAFDTQLNIWIAAAERFIDQKTGRSFVAETATKKFDGNDKNTLFVPDLLSVTSLTISDTALTSSEYHLYPANTTPKNWIKLDWGRTASSFEYDQQNVVIVGSWGYSETAPADIVLAATMLVAATIEISREGGIAISQSLGSYSVSFEEIVSRNRFLQDTLERYKKPGLATIVGEPEAPWRLKDVSDTSD